MKVQWTIGVLFCVVALAAHAQYKYIGPDGKVVYSDQPPPPTAKVLEKKVGSAQSSGGGELPFTVQRAMKSFPVTLYTAPNCGAPCSEGRTLLTQRGVPFTEKTVKTAEDAAEFRKTVNSEQLPVLLVGSNKQAQFEQGAWNSALNAAGYPTDNQLPAGYKNPAPVGVAPTAPVASPVAGNGQTPAAATPSTPPPAGPAEDPGSKPSWFKGF